MKYIFMVFGLLAGGFLPAVAQTFGVSYTTEGQYSPTSNKANWCNLFRTDFSLPIYENGEFNAATIHIYKLNQQRVIDDIMTFSNIEEFNNPFALALFGYTQNIGSSSLFLGVRNMNEDYFTSPATSFFTNSSCGIYPTISTNYPIANYPLSALCIDYKGQFDRWGLKASLYNGSGYNGWDGDDNPFIVDLERDGIFAITEANYQTDYGNYFLGLSFHNRQFLFDEESETLYTFNDPSVTLWGYVEQCLFSGGGHQVNLLAQYSQNILADNFCERYAGLGATWSYQDCRDHQHTAGVIFSAAQFDDDRELAAEITYRYQICSESFIQPAVHLIRNSAGFQSVLMLRFCYSIDWDLQRR